MTTTLLNILEEGQSSASSVVSSTTLDNVCQKKLELKERNYMGLSDCSSDESSTIVDNSERNKCGFNLKVTELRLGLPGSQSPERNTELCLQSPGKLDEKPLFSFLPSKEDILSPMSRNIVLGNKRAFSDAMEDFSQAKNTIFVEGNWMFPADGPESETAHSVAQGKFPLKSGINFMLSRTSQNAGAKFVSVQDQSGVDCTVLKDILPSKGSQEKSCGANGTTHNQMDLAANTGNPPAAKAQVIGWPPIRSYRKNTLSTTSKNKEDKNNEEVDGKPGPGALYVKVSMDGAPYLRKVDLRAYSSYNDLSSALGKMFSCFTIGPCGSHGPGREVLSESKLRDLLHGSEYVLAYEDKDLDWMLVGDVPWEMFIDSCKRLRIMKSSDAIGLAPRATEKCKEGLAMTIPLCQL